MKNLKKLISVIIAVIMIVGSFATVSAVDYKDVESTNSYAKAIQVLSGLGIVKGDDQGNFNPTNDIKRSEMVALICRAMGEEDVANGAVTDAFDDVAANHWAAGNIAWGVNRGIINGIGDRQFAPDASVSYQDAVVMIMRALGYDRIAQRKENGGYPGGYLKLASQYGVLTNAGYTQTKAATREIVAQLIFNALTSGMVDVTEYGDTVEDDKYVIYHGKGTRALKNLLTDINDIYRVKITIDETPKSDPTDCIDKNGEKMVEVTLADACDYYDIDTIDTMIGLNDGDTTAKLYVGETDVADYLGYTFEAYITDDEEIGLVILAAVADSKSVVEETITENLNTIEVSTGLVKYYADLEDNRKTEIEIATTGLQVYYNGAAMTSTEINSFDGVDDDSDGLAELLNANADKITFIGDKNAAYDKIFVTDYSYARVKSVNASEKLIKFEGIGSLDLDAESRGNEDFIYGLYNADGEAIELEDIEVDDVLNIVCPLDSGVKNQYSDVGYLDIYVTNETVTGKVAERRVTGEYVIDGVAYKAEGTSLSISEEGIFYITIDGKIMDKEAASAVSKNFAFLMNVEGEDLFGVNTYTVRIFKADGSKEDLVVAETLKFFDGSDTATIAKRKDGTQDAIFTSGGTLYDAVQNESSESDAKANLADRFISYKTNSANEITEIRIAGTTTAIAATAWGAKNYNAEFEEFGGETIGNAVAFAAEVSEISTGNYNVDADDIEIVNFASLDEDKVGGYNAKLYTVDGEDELAAVLFDAQPGLAYADTALAVVKSIGTKLDADDNTVDSITFVQSGKTLTLSGDYDDYDHGLAIGDVFQYVVDADGEIAEYAIVYDASARDLTTYADGFTVDADDMGFVFGVISELDDYMVLASDVDSSLVPTASAKFKFAEVEGATYAQLDEANTNNPVKVITINGLRETVRFNQVYAAVAKINENNRIEDVVVIALNAADFYNDDAVDCDQDPECVGTHVPGCAYSPATLAQRGFNSVDDINDFANWDLDPNA